MIQLELRTDESSAGPAAGSRLDRALDRALANRNDLNPPQLSCGFEELPYTRLRRSYHSTRGHWASSRLPPLSDAA